MNCLAPRPGSTASTVNLKPETSILRKAMNKKTATIWAMSIVLLVVFTAIVSANELTRTILRVSNLSCTSCLVRIDESLSTNAGVRAVNGDVRRGIVFVDHDPALAGDDIARLVSETGYPAEVIGTGTILVDDSGKTAQQSAVAGRGGCGSGGGGCGGSGAVGSSWSAVEKDQQLSRTTLAVSNLTCISCLSQIEAALRNVTGTIGMSGDLAKGTIVVDHQQSVAGEVITKLLEDIGYPAKIIDAKTITSSDVQPAVAVTGPPPSGQRRLGCSSGNGCNAKAAWQKLYEKYVEPAK